MITKNCFKLFFQSFFKAKIFNNFKISNLSVNDSKKLNFGNKNEIRIWFWVLGLKSKVLAILKLSHHFSEKVWTHFSRFYEPLYKNQASNISQTNEQARKRPPKTAKIITTSSLKQMLTRSALFNCFFALLLGAEWNMPISGFVGEISATVITLWFYIMKSSFNLFQFLNIS